MIRRVLISLTICILVGVHASGSLLADSLMRELEAVLDNRSHYQALKEAELDSLRSIYDNSTDDVSRFYALGELLDAYAPYNTDSALAISRRREATARRTGDSVLVTNARMNQANILIANGMYKEGLDILSTVNSSKLPSYLKPFYFHINRTLYGLLADYSVDSAYTYEYYKLTDNYRDSLLRVNEPGSLPYAVMLADRYNAHGAPEAAVKTLTTFLDSNQVNEHERAICAWTLSEAYAQLGDTVRQKEQLIISAIGDMKAAVREYVSMRQLSLLLYHEGDLERAYRLLNISIADATECNARQRIIELSETYPTVNSIYVETINKQRRSLMWLVVIITILLLFLGVVLWRLRGQMKQLARSRQTIAESNDRLKTLNIELIHSNEKLSEANRSIAENSRLKEVYIGRYMDQCLSHIEKLDSYRKSLGKLVSAGKSAEIKAILKSPVDVEDELKTFYDNFDKTFLSLFPTFVSDFNRLLLPEEAIVPKKEGSLTTELRIFALIRLGISDSDSIAKFLRYSLTTIYNYRTKVRNKAAGDRTKLEAEVMKIGRPSEE